MKYGSFVCPLETSTYFKFNYCRISFVDFISTANMLCVNNNEWNHECVDIVVVES